MKLVIVESPTKCNTIKRYLGDEYEVVASLGHICDLATKGKGGLGVDIENEFQPTYVVNKDKIHVINDLKKVQAKASEIILATDPDREGEAIAWHLARILNLDAVNTKRLEFHEITRESITDAIANPRTIDMDTVASQETRRILDRIIGFKLSSLLYKKIKSRSAGRVQSATLKLIADHDLEIKNFVPEEYWNITAKIKLNKHDFNLTILNKDKKAIEIKSEAEMNEILNKIPTSLIISDIQISKKTIESKPPFTTSTLQQEAFAKLKMKTGKTQFVAQSLYEGINVGDEHVGLITYMRTDSTRLSPTFIERANAYISDTFGKEYLGSSKRGKISENMQDAHEAIRPTSNHRTPESVKQYLTNDQYQLYKLIYNRTLGSLMKGKVDEIMTVCMTTDELTFKFDIARTIFEGYERVYKQGDDEIYHGTFPALNVGDKIDVIDKTGEQKFTQAPSHYSEAKVVKLMEDVGIGRPSTYASTIDILKSRKYVTDEKGILVCTEQGLKTAHVLEKYFPDLVNTKFTADMETKLDKIETKEVTRLEILNEFYTAFSDVFDRNSKIMYNDELEPTGRLCPKCGSPLVYKEGKNGRFVGCSNYPKCKFVEKEPKKVLVETGEMCPVCGKPLVEREDKRGNKFVACSGFPKCTFIKEDSVVLSESEYVKDCPKCGGHLIKKKGKFGYFLGCTNYPKCNYMEKYKKVKRK